MTRDSDPSRADQAAASATTAGNYFVANYPPFSFWRRDHIGEVEALLDRAPQPGVPLGLYVHVPFCRKRCDFCYFRVYTDKNSAAVRRYLDAVVAELAQYAPRAYLRGRRLQFVYFGGGTPSYLSVDQLTYLFEGLQRHLGWAGVEEVTFECEPGTLQESKLEALRRLGVTRLSLGIESFDPEILALNNRAHRAAEIGTAYAAARRVGFPQINVDLIAGMVGETEASWQATVDQTLALQPDSVTIYQMEIPYNTTVYRRMRDGGENTAPVADWDTKRRWVDLAFTALEADGYHIGSAYTAAKGDDVRFVYRDGLWHGADLLGLGVASFSHLGGLHFQNLHDFEPYLEAVEAGRLPLGRALPLSRDELLIRELVLQLKLGRVETRYFADKFGVDIHTRFAGPLRTHQARGMLETTGRAVTLTRRGLLQVDALLADFFLDGHRGARYA